MANKENVEKLPKYSMKYFDDTFEYRHIHATEEIYARIPKGKLMSEQEWRAAGILQSAGWEHYAMHDPEPRVLLFRRRLPASGITKEEEEMYWNSEYYEQQYQ